MMFLDLSENTVFPLYACKILRKGYNRPTLECVGMRGQKRHSTGAGRTTKGYNRPTLECVGMRGQKRHSTGAGRTTKAGYKKEMKQGNREFEGPCHKIFHPVFSVKKLYLGPCE